MGSKYAREVNSRRASAKIEVEVFVIWIQGGLRGRNRVKEQKAESSTSKIREIMQSPSVVVHYEDCVFNLSKMGNHWTGGLEEKEDTIQFIF